MNQIFIKFAELILKLEYRVRFELTVLRICNPLHWATLPPVHKIGGASWDRTRRGRAGGFTVHCITVDASAPLLVSRTGIEPAYVS